MIRESEFELESELEQELEEEQPLSLSLEGEIELNLFRPILTCPRLSTQSRAFTVWLQRALNRVLGHRIAESGVFSLQTRGALRSFQQKRGLDPTGTINPATQTVLAALSGLPTPCSLGAPDSELPIAEMESAPTRCPAESPNIIRGFSRYSDDIKLLPNDQQNKLENMAREITISLSGDPRTPPVTQVVIVGHADLDAPRERSEPGFLQLLSQKRALAVSNFLLSRGARVERVSPPPFLLNIGRGARALAVSNPRTEAERKCNRRVEITLLRSPQSPRLNEQQFIRSAADHSIFLEFYPVALQGTSGQYDQPQVAEKKAREIAEKMLLFFDRRKQELNIYGSTGWPKERFKDALQGTASKYSDTDVAINKAFAIAQRAYFAQQTAKWKYEWKQADLPQPMSGDCEIDRKVPSGSGNHFLCRPHEHVIDTTSRMVIAHDLEEYRRSSPRR